MQQKKEKKGILIKILKLRILMNNDKFFQISLFLNRNKLVYISIL